MRYYRVEIPGEKEPLLTCRRRGIFPWRKIECIGQAGAA